MDANAIEVAERLVATTALDTEVLDMLLDKALALIELRKFGAADRILDDVSRVRPNAVMPVLLLGECRLRAGDPRRAIHAFTEAIRRATAASNVPAVQRGFLGRADAWARVEDHDWARADLRAALLGTDAALVARARRALESLESSGGAS